MKLLRDTGILVTVFVTAVRVHATMDPCDVENHSNFPEAGSRNPECSNLSQICDYYLPPGWYVTTGSLLVNTCPPLGSCGVTYPVWMNGNYPASADAIVDRTACVVRSEGCCQDQVHIRMKNCSGFYAYFLQGLNDCSSAYCFASNMPCYTTTTTTSVSSTPSTETPDNKDGSGDGQFNEGLLAGLLCAIAILIVMFLVAVLFAVKTKKCQKQIKNSAVDVRQPTIGVHPYHVDENQPPPSYTEAISSEKYLPKTKV